MCTVFGWHGNISLDSKKYLIQQAEQRGRDGCGVWLDGIEYRGLTKEALLSKQPPLFTAKGCLGNFRATPTTEIESKEELLQPYLGVIHNGVIANDKLFGNFAIDSMVIPTLLQNSTDLTFIITQLQKIRGSYAIAYFTNTHLILACNYKPIYYHRTKDGIIFGSIQSMLLEDSIPLRPYHIAKINLLNYSIEYKEIPRKQSNKVLVSCSSGLDSTTVAYMLKNQGYEVHLVHFKYNCKAQPSEINRIKKIAEYGKFPLIFIDMPNNIMSGSIIEGDFYKGGVGGTEYAYDWVSARNLLMLSMMTAYAESNNFGYIAYGGNLEESGAYPDNEYEFGYKFNQILPFATQNGIKIELLQPLANYMKHEIVKIGQGLQVPYNLTWSCYDNGEKHCGTCGPCFMRKVAFERNGLIDPVEYE